MAAIGGFPGQDHTHDLAVHTANQRPAQAFRPVGGETVDAEGFAIITDARTMREGHVGKLAVLWMPGRSFASSVSMTVRPDALATVHRDGKGDVLVFRLPVVGDVPTLVAEGGVPIAKIWVNQDGESGAYSDLHDTPQSVVTFASLVEGVIRLASAHLI